MSTKLTPEQEQSLLEQVKHHREAFHPLYVHYFPRVYAYVAYRVGHIQDTEDIVSDIFTRVVKSIAEFEYRGEGAFAGWLFRIAHNRVQQFYRERGRQPESISIHDVPEIRSDDLTPDNAFIAKERFLRLRTQIATLSQRRQEIITLRFFGELRNQEIAEVLGLDERTVASHLSRGLDDLARKYEHESERDLS